jgi:hypothetical protein
VRRAENAGARRGVSGRDLEAHKISIASPKE